MGIIKNTSFILLKHNGSNNFYIITLKGNPQTLEYAWVTSKWKIILNELSRVIQSGLDSQKTIKVPFLVW